MITEYRDPSKSKADQFSQAAKHMTPKYPYYKHCKAAGENVIHKNGVPTQGRNCTPLGISSSCYVNSIMAVKYFITFLSK
uniref:Uncharacterized protein n=1 Tax=Anguilla anguilla TaxID=7936 RepID=A0A0E9W7K5_ANGAN